MPDMIRDGCKKCCSAHVCGAHFNTRTCADALGLSEEERARNRAYGAEHPKTEGQAREEEQS